MDGKGRPHRGNETGHPGARLKAAMCFDAGILRATQPLRHDPARHVPNPPHTGRRISEGGGTPCGTVRSKDLDRQTSPVPPTNDPVVWPSRVDDLKTNPQPQITSEGSEPGRTQGKNFALVFWYYRVHARGGGQSPPKTGPEEMARGDKWGAACSLPGFPYFGHQWFVLFRDQVCGGYYHAMHNSNNERNKIARQ